MKALQADLPFMTGKPRDNPEEQLQMAIVDHLRLRAVKDVLYWHCPNGMHRSKRAGARLKAMGVRRGVPDLQFLFPDGHVAFMELKGPNGRLSPDQTDFLAYCDRNGIECCLIADIDTALRVLEVWGVIR